MSLAASYMQSAAASWEQRTGYDDNGAPVYAPAVPIRARVYLRQRQIRDAQGNQVLSDKQIETTEAVSAGDRIDGREVRAIASQPGLGGQEAYRVVYL